jgi:hypothetical protein
MDDLDEIWFPRMVELFKSDMLAGMFGILSNNPFQSEYLACLEDTYGTPMIWFLYEIVPSPYDLTKSVLLLKRWSRSFLGGLMRKILGVQPIQNSGPVALSLFLACAQVYHDTVIEAVVMEMLNPTRVVVNRLLKDVSDAIVINAPEEDFAALTDDPDCLVVTQKLVDYWRRTREDISMYCCVSSSSSTTYVCPHGKKHHGVFCSEKCFMHAWNDPYSH